MGFERSYLFLGVPGSGKCVDEDTLIMDADTGLLKPIKEIVSEKSNVFSFFKDEGLRGVTPSAWLDTGKKECLTLITNAGHSLTATPEHPLLTTDGWKRLDELHEGDYIAGAAEVPFPTNTVEIPDDHVVLMATLLAEGCYTPSQSSVLLSNTDPEILEMVNNSLEFLRGDLNQTESMVNQTESMVNQTESMADCDCTIKCKLEKHNSLIWNFLEKYNLGRKLAKEKTIPDIVFQLNKRQLSLFIGVLWSCGGCVGPNSDLEFGLASRVFVEQVQHLLLRLGIRSNMVSKLVKCNGKEFDSWKIKVTCTTRNVFADTIPLFGPKKDLIKLVDNHYQSSSDDMIPMTAFVKQSIKDAVKRHQANGGFLTGIRKLFGWKNMSNVLLTRKGHITRRMFEAFLAEVPNSGLDWLLNARWERVVSIEDAGVRNVFDLTVPDTHNFLAADLVAHNTTFSQRFARAFSRKILQFSPEVVWSVNEADTIRLIQESGAEVLLIDEIDKLITNMNAHSLGQLLSRFEKFRRCRPGLITIFTANSVDSFPDAMLRPGRIDDIIEFIAPNPDDRKAILEGYAKALSVDVPCDILDKITEKSEGLTGAWLKEVIIQAKVSDATSVCSLIDKMLKYARKK